MSKEMLENIRDGSQSYTSVNRREAHYKICDHIKQRQSEWKGYLKDTQDMGKGLQKVFKTAVKYILQDLPPSEESGSEVSHFIPESRNSAKVTILLDDIKKPWLKATQSDFSS